MRARKHAIDKRVHTAWWLGRALSKRRGWYPKTDCGLVARNRLLSKVVKLVTCPKCKMRLRREALARVRYNEKFRAEGRRIAQARRNRKRNREVAIAVWWEEFSELSSTQMLKLVKGFAVKDCG